MGDSERTNENRDLAIDNVKPPIQEFSTSSGGTSEEDPPSAYTVPQQVNDNEFEETTMLSDFRVLHGRIKMNDSVHAPLFSHVKGQVHYYLPYCSKTRVEEQVKEYRADINKKQELNSYVNLYMSEVSVIYGGEGNVESKEHIKHVTEQDRNHIYLGHTVWFPSDLKTTGQEAFQRGVKEEGEFVIHEVRPINKLMNWSGTPNENRIPKRINTTAVPQSFSRETRVSAVDTWLVIARPISWTLKGENNLYAIGIMDTPKGTMPQIYQDVEVYTDNQKPVEKRNKSIKIKDTVGGKKTTVAIFQIVPCIKFKVK